MPAKPIVLSGMRTTGKLHLGNYFGALANWVTLQKEYQCYFMVADWHALTSDYADTSQVDTNLWEMVADWLGAGLDPDQCLIFRQSAVPAHAELHLILSMLTPLSWLERCPTYKEQIEQVKNKDLSTYGFLGYPVLQSADILLYNANKVPVGEDQLPHLELTREIARRFNHFYGNVLTEPQGLLSKTPKVVGLDGRKMSKSYDNAILISDTAEALAKKTRSMFTDPKKVRANDPGHPDGCVVYAKHKLFTPEVARIEVDCKAGTIACSGCKKRLTETMELVIGPIREKRTQWMNQKAKMKEIVNEGSRKAAQIAQETLGKVREAMKIQL